MSFLKAYYDIEKDKIIGCEPFSFVWWHEKGHQYLEHKYKFYSGFLQRLNQNWHRFSLIIFACAFFMDKLIIFLIFWGFFEFFNLWHELFAWLYAFKHYRRGDLN